MVAERSPVLLFPMRLSYKRIGKFSHRLIAIVSIALVLVCLALAYHSFA